MAEETPDKTITDLTVVSRNDDTDSPKLVEITAYTRADQAFALELLENAGRQKLGRDFDKSKLIQEALDLLIEKSIVAIRLRKNKLIKDGY